jgi:hypothetical protein
LHVEPPYMLHCTRVQPEILHRTNLPQLVLRNDLRVNGSGSAGVRRTVCLMLANGTDTPNRRCSRTRGHHANFLVGEIMFRNWMQLTHDAMLLGLESQRVMALRLMKLSRGGRAAHTETLRMFSEKTDALAEAGTTLARGGSAGTVIRRYRTHVRSNKRRLSKS